MCCRRRDDEPPDGPWDEETVVWKKGKKGNKHMFFYHTFKRLDLTDRRDLMLADVKSDTFCFSVFSYTLTSDEVD